MRDADAAAAEPAATVEGCEIRPLRSQEELAACVALQGETWGRAYADIVPASLLQVAAKVGGVVTGAFDAQGALLGFVFGITGVRGGETAHWSHMLAVRADARGRGIGTALKRRQREELRALGIASVFWTFDPLVARNAHLNINRLGAEVQEYVPDFYGASASDLHELGTDRLVVKWTLSEEGGGTGGGDGKAGGRAGAAEEAGRAATPDGAAGTEGEEAAGAEIAEIFVPSDIDALRAESRDAAMEWRRSSRRAFVSLLGAGYSVRGFERGRDHGRYLLAQGGR